VEVNSCSTKEKDCPCTVLYYSLFLTLILLMWRIWRAPNNASRWQTGFSSAFKGLKNILNMGISLCNEILNHIEEMDEYSCFRQKMKFFFFFAV